MSEDKKAQNNRILIIDDTVSIHNDFDKILVSGEDEDSDFNDLEASLFGEEKKVSLESSFELTHAYQGQEALELVSAAVAEGKPFAMAFVDVRMPPGWDGIETISRLWEVDPDLLTVICTAFSDYSWDETIERLGQTDKLLILKKPFDEVEVRQLAHALVEKWNLGLKVRRQVEILEETVKKRTAHISLQNEKLEKMKSSIENSLRDTVMVLATLLETYSPSLGIHSKSVAKSCLEMGKLLNLHEVELRDLEFAGYLHDFGKMSRLNESVGRRTQYPDASSVAGFAEAGYTILSTVSGFENIALAVRHQMERYDGRGYPDRLEKGQIPLGSRIIAIANAYDELVYRGGNPARPQVKVGKAKLKAGKGKLFEPDLVDLFFKYLESQDSKGSMSEVEMSPRQLQEGMVLARDLHRPDGTLLLKTGTLLTPRIINILDQLTSSEALVTKVFVRLDENTVAPA